MHDWRDVYLAEGSNAKADQYQRTITWAVEKFFPKKTTRRRSTDLPWLNKKVLKMISGRKLLFKEEGGSGRLLGRKKKLELLGSYGIGRGHIWTPRSSIY